MIVLDENTKIIFERKEDNKFNIRLESLVPEQIVTDIVINVGDTMTITGLTIIRNLDNNMLCKCKTKTLITKSVNESCECGCKTQQ